MQPLDSVPMARLVPLPFGCRRTPFELMDFGLESSQLVHPFSSQREFALRINACEPPPHCGEPPLKTGPKRHTRFEVSVCSWTSTMIWTWTCQFIFILGMFNVYRHNPFTNSWAHQKGEFFWSLIFDTVSEGIYHISAPLYLVILSKFNVWLRLLINKSPWFDSVLCKTPIEWQLS